MKDKEYIKYLKDNVMTSKMVSEELGVTREGIRYLIREKKLTPVISERNTTIFGRREVERYKKERDGD
ncbi:MAG: helix-turn-helix domain-containing protein [Halanaerobiales bacterium]|nr:helix-turn-helix domain-containing protein [Halanaerobiales bacterium]